jgi:hypothetical protein
MNPQNRSALVSITFALLSPGLGAASICHWVDEDGRTQLSDVVPDRYKSVAHCTSSLQYELSPEQKKAAEKRAVEERSRARSLVSSPLDIAPSRAPGPSGATPPSGAKRPAEVVTDSTDCRVWWRIFDESTECFGPYRTVRGIKPEAFENCNVVSSPELKCGPRTN